MPPRLAAVFVASHYRKTSEMKPETQPATWPSPSPVEIKEARVAAGLTQTEAAALVLSKMRSWQNWESGVREMHPAVWELFQIKVADLKR